MVVFADEKSSNHIINIDTMSDDEVVASDVHPRYLFCISEKAPSARDSTSGERKVGAVPRGVYQMRLLIVRGY